MSDILSMPAPDGRAADTTPSATCPARPQQGLPGSLGVLLCAELERTGLLLLRYPVQAIGGVIALGFSFFVLLYLGQVWDGKLAVFSGRVSELALSYCLWTLVSTAVTGVANQVATDAAAGVLEPLFLVGTPVVRVFEVRAVGQAVQGAVVAMLLCASFCLGTRWLPSAAVLAAFALALIGTGLSAVGIAAAVSGIALFTKRMGPVTTPITFLCMMAMMGGTAQQAATNGGWRLALPFTADAALVRGAIAHGDIALQSAVLAIAGAVPLWLAGRLILARCAWASRRAGSTQAY